MGRGRYDEPGESGEVESKLRVLVVSTRVSIVGEDVEGEVKVARDLVELLLGVADERPMVVLFDTHAPSIELDLFGRIARDFPSQIAILVRGGGEEARTQLYANGVYRARCYAPSPTAPCDATEGELVLETSVVLERVRRRLDIPATIPVGRTA